MKTSKFLFPLLVHLGMILLCVSCDGSPIEDQSALPTNIGLEEIDQLGEGPIAWVEPNNYIFVYSPIAAPMIISYHLDTGDISELGTPGISLFPTIGISSQGNVIGYTSDNGEIVFQDINSGKFLASVPGSSVAISNDGTMAAIWDKEHLYALDLSKSDTMKLIYKIDSILFWDEMHRPVLTSWRPKSNQVAVLVNDVKDKDSDKILIVDDAGTNANEVIINKQLISFSWSPDGDSFAYSYRSLSGGSTMEIYNINKNCPVYKVHKPMEIYPRWSPDGQSIFLYKTSNGIEIIKISDIPDEINQPCRE